MIELHCEEAGPFANAKGKKKRTEQWGGDSEDRTTIHENETVKHKWTRCRRVWAWRKRTTALDIISMESDHFLPKLLTRIVHTPLISIYRKQKCISTHIHSSLVPSVKRWLLFQSIKWVGSWPSSLKISHHSFSDKSFQTSLVWMGWLVLKDIPLYAFHWNKNSFGGCPSE